MLASKSLKYKNDYTCFKMGKKYITENRDQNFNNQRNLTICVVINDIKMDKQATEMVPKTTIKE